MSSTIFVQIAAYRDPDLPATLHNLIQRAAQPERLRFGICLQLAADDPPHWGTSAFPDHPHLKCIRFDAAESRGACWARRQAQGVYGGEDFLLQIDSHMRAVEHWDDLLLTTWRECSDERAVLSVYPNGFQQPCRLQTSTLPVMELPALIPTASSSCEASADSNFQKNNLIAPSPVHLSPEASCSARAQS